MSVSESDLIVRVEGAVGRLSLNRPRVLNALTHRMCRQAAQALTAWRDDPAVHTVLIDHSDGRGFCAGADVRAVAEAGRAAPHGASAFFHDEYRLDALLFRYPKPVVAILDGVVMGGGVGISRPARFRIATERTLFAMPECAIGLFPDVGAGWYLPRLPGSVGLWLALTGARLGPADCLLLGLATDYIHSDNLPGLKEDLLQRPDRFEERLTELEEDAGEPPIALVRDDIDRLFGRASVEEIVEALRADGSDWAREQLGALEGASPTSLKVAFRQMRIGAGLERFEDELAMEYRIACRLGSGHDFAEGVRAKLVDRDGAPVWDPPDLAAVDAERVEAVFAPLPQGEEWSPLD